MTVLTRRRFLGAAVAASVHGAGFSRALAQPATQGEPPRFGFEDVVRRARDLAWAPFEAQPPRLADGFDRLDYDAWRDIRFRPDKALLGGSGGLFRLQTFHLGFLYKRPVTVNTIRDGIATPIPYSTALFDYGRNKLDKPLPVNAGFGGFRLHYPLNDPHVLDEAISFLGASYFRFLGRGQRYGLSARALCVDAGTDHESFPFFREFWIETPQPQSNAITIFALLDGEAATGAFRFDLAVGRQSVLDVSATLFARRGDVKLGLAPLTSMYLTGETGRRVRDGFRMELHDSDGLLIHTGAGEWIWRPLGNPAERRVSAFLDRDNQGYGLIQRHRNFEAYQDIDLAYELRPNYFVEPQGAWGEGKVELVELPALDEATDNIVASFIAANPPEAGKPFAYAYRLSSCLDSPRFSPNGRAINTFETNARALGSGEPVTPGTHRFLIDFSGGDLAYYASDPSQAELVATASNGAVLRGSVFANPHVNGLRAMFDVAVKPGETADLRAFLRAGSRALTETWTLPWTAP